MDQRQSRALPRPVGDDGTTIVSNGRFYVEGPDIEAELDLKADAHNPVMTGNMTLGTTSADQHDISGRVFIASDQSGALVVEQFTSGTNILSVSGFSGRVQVDSGFEFNPTGPLNHDGTTVGFYGATPVTQPAANADTSGATLPDLEIEVNQIKALLRSLGLMAT